MLRVEQRQVTFSPKGLAMWTSWNRIPSRPIRIEYVVKLLCPVGLETLRATRQVYVWYRLEVRACL